MLESGTTVVGVTGARAGGNDVGLRMFWRRVGTQSVQDPVAHRRAEVGRYGLLDGLPEPTWYT